MTLGYRVGNVLTYVAHGNIMGDNVHKCYTCRMETVAIRDLRNNTAKVVQKVREGQTVVLASRGEPVARIVPIENRRRGYLTPVEVLNFPKADPDLRRDLALMGDDDTDELGPIQ